MSPADGRHLVVVNLADAPAQARVLVPWGEDLRGHQWDLADALTGETFRRDGDELAGDGLYVGLEPWGACVFSLLGSSIAAPSPTTPNPTSVTSAAT